MAFRGGAVILTLISFVRRRQRGDRAPDAEPGAASDAPADLSPEDFAKLVARAFRREGFLVVVPGAGRQVPGIDLELLLGRERYVVHCRCWQETLVDARTVREILAAISAERAVGGFIVTSGKFTDEARKIALGRSIRLVPADSVYRLMPATTATGSGEIRIAPEFSHGKPDPLPPGCPRCGKVMMRRAGKHADSANFAGWGCTSFPACRGSRDG